MKIQPERLLSSLIDALPEHIVMLDENGVIVAANQAWKDFSSRNNGPEDGFVGQNYIDITEKSAAQGDLLAKKAVEHIRKVLEDIESRFEMEYPCSSPTEERWFLMQCAPMRHKGDVTGVVISHLNITGRKILEQELDQNRVKYKTIAEFAGDWEWWLSPEGEFQYMSPSCKDITGYKAEEFIEDPGLIDCILHPGDRGKSGYTTIEHIRESPTHYDEFRIRHKNGTTVWIGHLCRPVYGPDGEWLGRRATNRDITRKWTWTVQLKGLWSPDATSRK